ncbi:MAG TPA: HAD family hydrolase [Desulfosalsimonadaceae bacterium]|nr:HAD family hydrolase [Desulfosalsimonadaceae bacterium]
MGHKDLIQKYITPLQPILTDMEPAGHLRAPVKAVLFDVYGTLFVSRSGDISIAKQEAQTGAQLASLIQAYEYPGSADDLIDAFSKAIQSSHEAMRRRGIDYPEVQIDEIWQQVLEASDIEKACRFAVEFEMIVNPGYPMPYLESVLSAFRDSPMVMGIVSNAQFFTPILFQTLLGALPENIGFEANLVLYSYQHGVAKPSRRLFQLAAEELKVHGIAPKETVYVGNDMLNDMLPAYVEGFQTALFAGDKRSLRRREDDPRCQGISPDLVITDLRQLVKQVLK